MPEQKFSKYWLNTKTKCSNKIIFGTSSNWWHIILLLLSIYDFVVQSISPHWYITCVIKIILKTHTHIVVLWFKWFFLNILSELESFLVISNPLSMEDNLKSLWEGLVSPLLPTPDYKSPVSPISRSPLRRSKLIPKTVWRCCAWENGLLWPTGSCPTRCTRPTIPSSASNGYESADCFLHTTSSSVGKGSMPPTYLTFFWTIHWRAHVPTVIFPTSATEIL